MLPYHLQRASAIQKTCCTSYCTKMHIKPAPLAAYSPRVGSQGCWFLSKGCGIVPACTIWSTFSISSRTPWRYALLRGRVCIYAVQRCQQGKSEPTWSSRWKEPIFHFSRHYQRNAELPHKPGIILLDSVDSDASQTQKLQNKSPRHCINIWVFWWSLVPDLNQWPHQCERYTLP